MTREVANPVPDTQVVLRKRLACCLVSSGSGALGKFASMTSLPPHTLEAFARGAHLAHWAATRLETALDAGEGGG